MDFLQKSGKGERERERGKGKGERERGKGKGGRGKGERFGIFLSPIKMSPFCHKSAKVFFALLLHLVDSKQSESFCPTGYRESLREFTPTAC